MQDVFLWDRLLSSVVLVSRSSSGIAGNGDSSLAVISADGVWVAFRSTANNLAPDANGSTADIFRFSRLTSEVQLVSVSSSGEQGTSEANNPDISANGRYVSFDVSGALTSGAGSLVRNVFRRDAWQDTTRLISKTTAGIAPNGMSFNAQMSADGQRIVFVSTASNLVTTPTVGKDSFLFDVRNDTTTLLSLNTQGQAGDGTSYFPTISGDGGVAAFHSFAGNLSPNDSAGSADIFIRDLQSGQLELISRTAELGPANSDSIHPALDFTGNRVAYTTFAGNLVAGGVQGLSDVLLFDRSTQTTTRLSQTDAGAGGNGNSGSAALSLDGSTAVILSQAINLAQGTSGFGDLLVANVSEVSVIPVLAAAVLPSGRSAQVGSTLTVFASVLATQLVNGCTVALDGFPGVVFDYQLTDPVSNAAIGPVNGEYLLLPGVPQTMLFTVQPNVPLSEEELEFLFTCEVGAAPVVLGTNTLLVSAENSQPPDVVALVATTSNDGILNLQPNGAGGAFSVASINVGSEAEFRVRPVVQGAALDAVSICQTNTTTGECLGLPDESIEVFIGNGDTPTFALFVSNLTPVSFAPATNRLIVQFEDSAGIVRGRTSVAVRSLP